MQRTIAAPVCAALGAFALLWSSTAGAQQAYPSFRDVDFFYSQQPQVFQALWQTAKTQTVRIAVLGDSQETSPGSHGFQYIPLLNYEMWKRFGNSPETPVAGCFNHGNSSPANWLLAGQCATPGPTATRLDATQILPNANPTAISTLNSASNVTGGNRGQLTMLRHDASGVDASTEIPTDVSYFNTSGTVKARIYAASHPESGEIAYRARPNASASVSYAAATTTSGALTLGLRSSTFAIKSGETSPLEFNGENYLQLEVFGSSDSALTDIVGLRFINQTHPEGVVIDNFSLSGYTASRFLSTHANAGPMFAALGFHAAVIHYGANEGLSVSAAKFESNIAAVIARVRAWVDDSNFPIILIADVYEGGVTPTQTLEYDRYVGAQLAIAQRDPNVMVINARRLMEDIGWNATSGLSDQFLADRVHYTGFGARALSAAVVAAMMGEIHLSGCSTDPRALTLQTSMTLVVDIGGTTACTNHGQLAVAQALTLNGPALKVQFANDFTPAAGDRFKLLSFDSIAGEFASLQLPTLPAALSWNTDELYTSGTIGVEDISAPDPPPDPPDPPVSQDPPDPPPPDPPPTTTVPEPSTGSATGGSENTSGARRGGGGPLDLLTLLGLALLTIAASGQTRRAS